PAGEARLRGRLPASARLRTLAALDAGAILEAIRAEGCRRVLTEGGPRMLTSLIAAGLVDELFLTLAPVLAGRNGGERLGLLTGLELLPSTRRPGRLLSVKSQGSLLFLRYLLQRT
ncbi:MAG: dihydrofolate reductase family protein, partial [Candidatus Dormibacteraeota bacterium]|nr:dihydrofolate reductase family protein [Candidatus Dormibacteraeota bacterium]